MAGLDSRASIDSWHCDTPTTPTTATTSRMLAQVLPASRARWKHKASRFSRRGGSASLLVPSSAFQVRVHSGKLVYSSTAKYCASGAVPTLDGESVRTRMGAGTL